MESENKQKISGISYNIISYDPRSLGLITITHNVVADFLELVGGHAPIQTSEYKGDDKLVSEWKALGTWRKVDEVAFCNRLETLYNKAASRPPVSRKQRGILVTSLNIGRIVGLFCDGPTIISSYQISNHRETFATAVFHELGHSHKIPSLQREKVGNHVTDDSQIVALEQTMRGRNAIFECLGEHCLNTGCSMRQRLCFANWRLHLTKERTEIGRPYCDKCIADLKAFFSGNREG